MELGLIWATFSTDASVTAPAGVLWIHPVVTVGVGEASFDAGHGRGF